MVEAGGSSPLERIKFQDLIQIGNRYLIKKILDRYKKQSFLLSYSGGLDSTVLLHQLIKIKQKTSHIKIRAIHINHNLTSISKKWSEHCQKTCHTHQIPLIIENIHFDIHKNNIEEKLRIQRYNIIANHLLIDEILLTGHHMNDQCETFFLSLKRGSGPSGLSSMSYETMFGRKKIVRPLLHTTKKELELWATKKNLCWIEDFSNVDLHYDRNFIRHQIIPILTERWPFFIKNCFRTVTICREETELLKYFLDDKIDQFIKFNDSLDISTFKVLRTSLATALIRHWIALTKIQMLSYKNIQYIYNQILFSRNDANPKIVFQKNEIRRYKTNLYVIKKQINLNKTILFWHNLHIPLVLPFKLGKLVHNPTGMTLPEPKKNELINIRFQYEGNILILGRHKKCKIKKIWQEKNIPPWHRNQIPLLFYNNIFISALGVFVVQTKEQNKKTCHISWETNIKKYNKNVFFLY